MDTCCKEHHFYECLLRRPWSMAWIKNNWQRSVITSQRLDISTCLDVTGSSIKFLFNDVYAVNSDSHYIFIQKIENNQLRILSINQLIVLVEYVAEIPDFKSDSVNLFWFWLLMNLRDCWWVLQGLFLREGMKGEVGLEQKANFLQEENECWKSNTGLKWVQGFSEWFLIFHGFPCNTSTRNSRYLF